MASVPERPIALVGARCAGKTTVGRLLAAALGRPFVDLDERVLEVARHAGLRATSAGELLDRAGQARFRALEATALRLVLEPMPRLVLATGGGVVEREDNRAWLERTATCVWLSVPLELLRERLRADPTPRPPLLGADAAGELGLLLARREPLYRALAQETLDCGTESPESLCARLLGRWRDAPDSGGEPPESAPDPAGIARSP